MKPTRPLSRPEFIALVAMMMAIVAFSIDSMLPALPQIARTLSPDEPNRAQLIITSFVLGMGLGTLFTGPLSDSFGRKPVVIGGAALYGAGALIAWRANSLEVLLAARVMQGLGAAGPRVVAVALVRDLYSGRAMARIMSLVMMIFILIPAIAPTIGAGLISLFGWRQIFLAFIVFAVGSTLWLMLRQPETLPREARRKLALSELALAARDVLGHPSARLAILAQTLILAMLFSALSQIQSLFATTYGQEAEFPLWFAGVALFAGAGSLLNARLVMRLGMQRLALSVMVMQVGLSAVMVSALLLPLPVGIEFAVFLLWMVSIFFQISLSMGNLNALAMEPMGHIAGMAAALISAIPTMGAALIAAPVGLAYDGTALPMAVAVGLLALLAGLVIARIPADG